jgi:predicted DsbA family dithiol-disulfide isomerase
MTTEEGTMLEPIKVDVWSDVVCPWCYIGKRKLEAGVAAFAGGGRAQPPVEIGFHSFELSPEMPLDFEGTSIEFLVRHKGISETKARQMQEHVSAIAATVGLVYDLGAARPTSTLRAHQLLHLAKTHSLQPEMKERLLSAHLVEGRHVGRKDELADLASEVGLDGEEVLRSLEEEEFLPEVRADQKVAAQLGIRGVPFVVIGGRFGISGAQPPEVFTEALTKYEAERADGSLA